ncbi:hypothetical protein [Antarcticimicrobium sediminis]|uniref:Uncharacterized protein n=1 Tax=Antarcticimicrobium sediminis TaxID=2546227 RepID=A0A4R5EG16_9RHOB|nr:hypothetical protein [Antarcticimicrobium sediminis]TDE33349.1 hypothetical protein E1B25_21300 [Antarcticimicrobium sediminis]
MGNNLTPQSRLKDVPWIVIRRMFLTTLCRSPNKVLLTREISKDGQALRRWLPPDVDQFMSKVAAVANDLRPVANLEALPKADDRLMVDDGKRGHYVRGHTLSAGEPLYGMCRAAHGHDGI